MNRVSSVNDAGVARTYGYDARGNVTSNGKHSFYYDLSDQPTGVSGVGSYVYDGNLKRVKSIQGGKTTYSVYSLGGQVLYTDVVFDTNIGNKKTDYIRAAGQTIARIENTTVKYPHNDLLGSPVSATTSTGTVEWREQYTPYGEKRIDPTQNKDNVGFTGHVQDDITGLTYMQARYYDPAIGRFLSIDPVGFTPNNPMSFNRYAYANNNPYMYVDPDGMSPVNLGSGFTGRIDQFNYKGQTSFELHVFDKNGIEKGIMGADGDWIAKHGFDGTPPSDVPNSVHNSARGNIVDKMRGAGRVPEKGSANIKGSGLKKAISKFILPLTVVAFVEDVANEGVLAAANNATIFGVVKREPDNGEPNNGEPDKPSAENNGTTYRDMNNNPWKFPHSGGPKEIPSL